jgi:hypothetical protein
MISGNNGTPFHREHAKSEQERKMAILNNIKQQINLTQNNKIQELERKRSSAASILARGDRCNCNLLPLHISVPFIL